MGVFSKHFRFHDAGEDANVNNVERFGTPHHSLYTSSKVLSLHHDIEIFDDNERVVYRSRSKFFSIKDKTDIVDASGKQVAHIESKVFTIHEKHSVTMADGTAFVLSTEILHLVKDIINIEGLGWQLRGNIAELNYEIYDTDGSVIAVIGQKFMSLHDKYCIDIYRPELEPVVVTILITLQHMIRDRENARSASYSSSSGS